MNIKMKGCRFIFCKGSKHTMKERKEEEKMKEEEKQNKKLKEMNEGQKEEEK